MNHKEQDILQAVKNLPRIGIGKFCELIMDPKIKKLLTFKQSKEFSIDETITILSSVHKTIFFFKGDRLRNNVEDTIDIEGLFNGLIVSKCNVQEFLAKIAVPSREDVRYVDKEINLLERIKDGKYKFIEGKEKETKKIIKERTKFIKKSAIDKTLEV